MARCGCGGGLCNCLVQAGRNVTVSGSGSTANGYVISSEVPCEDVRDCLSAGPGVSFDQDTGVIAANVSPQQGNNLVVNPDGSLAVPTAGGQVLTGCGLTGDGSGSAPVAAATSPWPYSCSIDDFGGVVSCDSAGRLRSEPRGRVSFESYFESREYPDITVPAEQNQGIDNFTVLVTNPDTCRSALVITEREVDVYFVLPAGAGAASGHLGDEMYYTRNTGSSSIVGAHCQTTKLVGQPGMLGPGATIPITLDAAVGRGSGGAYYYRVEFTLRALVISL
ncbi:hypothetical protein [Streptomyces sp. AD55]|uniref:hypothetical protein n=1 Tax=Streptomyces sp. AD55 TaxID=3242895 RepID=UPI0035287DCA